MCHDHHQPYELFQDINWVHDEKYHPCRDDLCYLWPLYCLLFNTNLFVFCVIPWVPCYPAFVLLYLGVLPSFNIKDVVRTTAPLNGVLGIMMLLAITILFLAPVLSELCCENLISLATLLFRSEWLIVSLSNHHSNFDCPTWSIFPGAFRSVLNCGCSPRSYSIICPGVSNAITLFT